MHIKKITSTIIAGIIALSVSATDSFADTKGKVTASALNVRSGPSTKYNKVGTVYKNNTLTILDESNKWYKVKLSNGKTGWVSGQYINKTTTKPATTPSVTGKKKVKASSLNVRSGPSTKDKIIGSLKKGAIVEVTGTKGDWTIIKYNGKTAYVSSAYLVNVSTSTPTPTKPTPAPSVTGKKKVKASSLNVRSGPSTKDKIIGSLKKGAVVEVTGTKGDWTIIKYNGKTAYVSSAYLVNVSTSTPTPPAPKPKDIVGYQSVKLTLDEYIDSQVERTNKSADVLKPYIDPSNFKIEDKVTFMQFLKINKFREIDVKGLNSYLNSLKVDSGKTNIYYNQGQAFVNAAKKYNIDPIYLVAHTLHETGFGMSNLAQGYEVVLSDDGKAQTYVLLDDKGNAILDSKGNEIKYVQLRSSETPVDAKVVRVHNLFGIGAVDSAPTAGGTTTAYNNGWTSMSAAIDGSAKWIRDNYIYRDGHAQDTVYKMRFDYVNKWHQYATDLGWANKISKFMNDLSSLYVPTDLEFEIPKYATPSYTIPTIGDKPINDGKPFYVNSPTELKLNVRSGPTTNFRIVGELKHKDPVLVYGYTSNGWAIIKINGEVSYVSNSYLTAQEPK